VEAPKARLRRQAEAWQFSPAFPPPANSGSKAATTAASSPTGWLAERRKTTFSPLTARGPQNHRSVTVKPPQITDARSWMRHFQNRLKPFSAKGFSPNYTPV